MNVFSLEIVCGVSFRGDVAKAISPEVFKSCTPLATLKLPVVLIISIKGKKLYTASACVCPKEVYEVPKVYIDTGKKIRP